ncbi:hypothetical protein [Dokdonia sp.]|uniref:hypothetical protein n=1 Tax=Dokdonia sp. TaxID=2024995 RepID=UPI0032652ECD
MKHLYLLIIAFLCVNCSSDEKPIEIVLNDIEHGAVIRTLAVNYAEFHPGDLTSTFNVDIEEQDLEDGNLLEEVDVYIRFLDNTLTSGNASTQEVLHKTFTKSDFTIGANGFPTTNLSISYQEAIDATGVAESLIACKDQFLVRLDLKLTDGRSFSFGDSSSNIIAFDTFFSSPFCYTINVVEPIAEDVFTGVYDMESLVNSARLDVPVFTELEEDFSAIIALFEIRKGHSTNTRVFDGFYANGHRGGERFRTFEFTVACDEIIFQKNQFSSYRSACTSRDPIILLGPSETNGLANSSDDTVFTMHVLEGYLGFDGGCGFGSHEAIVKFSKQ